MYRKHYAGNIKATIKSPDFNNQSNLLRSETIAAEKMKRRWEYVERGKRMFQSRSGIELA
jgi:hypothetical protein